jgi:hypothetical protein
LQKEKRGFRRLFVLREIALNALLLLAAEGRVREDHIHAVALSDVRQLVAEGVGGIDLRRVESVQQQVHLAEQIWQRFRFTAEEGFLLQDLAVSHGLHLFGQMIVGFDEEAACAAGRVEHGLAEGSVTATMKRTTARGV